VAPALSVIIPTRDRATTIAETLTSLATQPEVELVEVIVVDDGSEDDTFAVLERAASTLPIDLHPIRRPRAGGPGAARNSGIEHASAPVLLFLGDDMRPAAPVLSRHLAFHRRDSGSGAALIGRIVPAPSSDSPFARWLHEQGKQFAFGRMSAEAPVPADFFYAANCSLKRELLTVAGGFDERLEFGHEERELAARLVPAGLRLRYDPEALVEHDHPTDLAATLRRMRAFGRAYRGLAELMPAVPEPRRPGPRHRARAAALRVAARASIAAAREPSWEFLCEQAHREAFWGEPDPPPEAPGVRIGAGLARLVARDPAVRSGQARERQANAV